MIIYMILIAVVFFFLLREVFCWYYKINDIKKIMEEQRDLLKRLVEKGHKESDNTESPTKSLENYADDHPLNQ